MELHLHSSIRLHGPEFNESQGRHHYANSSLLPLLLDLFVDNSTTLF